MNGLNHRAVRSVCMVRVVIAALAITASPLAMAQLPVLSIAAPTSTATEGAALAFRVTRTGLNLLPVAVDCVSSDGTAKAGGSAPYDDYVATTQQIVFLPTDPSPSTKLCQVSTKDDSYYEGAQTVRATLSNVVGLATISVATADGTIADNDAAPRFSATGPAVAESSALIFAVAKVGASELTHQVTASTSDGTATIADSDYTAVSGAVLTFASGTSQQTVSVATTHDTKYENDETVMLNLANPSNGAIVDTPQVAGTVSNNDAGPLITISDVTVSEGGVATLTVSKSGSTALSHSVAWATANDTATAGGDYTAGSGTVSFGPTETTKTIQVQTKTDIEIEGTERFFVNLSAVAGGGGTNGASIADPQGAVTVNNVIPPSFAINDPPAVNEGGLITFAVSQASNDGASHTLSWTTTNSSATAGSDFTAASGTLTFAPSDTSKTIQVQTLTDSLNESTETFFVDLGANGDGAILIQDGRGIGTINNPPVSDAATYTYDELGRVVAVMYADFTGQIYTYDKAGNRTSTFSGKPSVLGAGGPYAVNEAQQASITVSRTGDISTVASVSYSTLNETAVAGVNYTATSGVLTFPIGTRNQTVNVPTLNDGKYNIPLTFLFRLSGESTNAAIGPSDARVTVNNINSAPQFSISAGAAANEGGSVSFTITKTNATALSHSVSYATATGTAGSSDFTASSGTLTFPAATTSQVVQVSTLTDSLYEASETFAMNLSSPTAGATIGTAGATGTITNTTAAPSFSINSDNEPEGQTLQFVVTRTGDTSLSHSVNYATANGTAIAGTNYTATSGTLTFPASNGNATQNVSVNSLSDGAGNGTKTFSVNLSSATAGAVIGGATGTGTVTDNATPPGMPASISPSVLTDTDGQYTITWTTPTSGGPVTSYELSEGSAPNAWGPPHVYTGPNLNKIITNKPNGEYWYGVRACNASGCSAYRGTAYVHVCIGACD